MNRLPLQLPIQFRREFWETRGSFVRTPIWIALVLAALLLMGMLTSSFEIDMALSEFRQSPEQMNEFEEGAELLQALMRGDLFSSHPQVLRMALAAISIPFVFALLLISQMYLLGCLYGDRKDKSVLFWKSLPVSETRVVLTKLAFGALLGPAIFLVASLVVGLLHLLMMLGFASFKLGVEMPGLGTLLSTFIGHSLGLISGWLLFALWFAPLFAWLLLASAWSRKSPFLVAFGLPVAVMVVELWLLRSVNLWNAIWVPSHESFAALVQSQLRPWALLEHWGQALSAPAFWLGAVVAAAFTAGAIWLRNYRYEL